MVAVLLTKRRKAIDLFCMREGDAEYSRKLDRIIVNLHNK